MAKAGKADFTLDGYPEYGTDSNLDSTQKDIYVVPRKSSSKASSR